MPELSTTPADNPTDDDASKSTTVTTDPAAGTDSGTATGDDPDASKSDDTTVVTDDDKSKDTKTTDKTDDAPATPTFDDDLDDWIGKRGLKVPETDTERQALQDLRNEQRDFTRTRQADKEAADAKALGEEIHKTKTDVTSDDDDDDLDPLEKRQRDLEAKFEGERTTRIQSEFYQSNKVTDEEHKALLDIYKEKTSRPTTPEAKKAAVDFWSSPEALPDLLDLAKARLTKATDTSAVADEAARKERERIAKESESKSPGRNATTTTTSDKSEDEARTERFRNRFKS